MKGATPAINPPGRPAGGPSAPARLMRLAALSALAFAALAAVAEPSFACPDLARAPTSRWSTRLEGGAQFLVTPCGESFFSLGVNIVSPTVPIERIDGRKRYQWSRFYPSVAAGIADTRRRLAAWGFNTIGGWSMPPSRLDMPSIIYLGLGLHAKFHWDDPFSPATEEEMRRAALEMVAPYRGDPRRIGYFTDNEEGWWSGALFFWFSKKPEANHTKRRWVEMLRAHYGDDWGRFALDFAPPAGVASWPRLLAATSPTRLRPHSEGIAAVREWTALVAERYYSSIARALHAADPDALLFGDRLPIYYDPVAIPPMARHMDVMAINYNVDGQDGWIAHYFFDGLRKLSGGKPVLISEWFFAAHENRSGNRNAGHLMTVATQDERARGAAAATLNLAAVPEIVGMHWFQYPDHPRGGRGDGEDYNFGLVDIDNHPYRRLTAAFAAANRLAVERHRAARPDEGGRAGPISVPYAAVAVHYRTLNDWPKPKALLPPLQPKPGEIAFGEAYLAWDDSGLSFATIGQDYYDIDILAYRGAFPLDEAYRLAVGIDAGAGPRRFTLFFTPPSVKGKNYPIMKALLCVDAPAEIASCRAPEGGEAMYFGSDQPRVVAKAHLPWAALGVSGPPANSRIRVEVAGTAWHRARWMSLSGLAPEEGMSRPEMWRDAELVTRTATAGDR